jgi:multidrug efflux pump subunit AcrA (membrane-fusion protein)
MPGDIVPTASPQEPSPASPPGVSEWRHASLDLTPEVADLLTEAPGWAARGLVYLAVIFAIGALAWARLSVIDIVVEARGTVVPEGYVQHIQVETDGVVRNIPVREGATVRRGDTLFVLDVRDLRTRASYLHAELANSEEQLRQELVMRGATGDSLERQNRITRLRDELVAIERAIAKGAITAPVDGTITALDVMHAGTVIRAGQAVAAIAPADAPLIVDAQVPNARIGFVAKGLPVKIKLDAFPFQDYGSMSGTIVDISADARSKDQQASFYRVLIAPHHGELTAHGKKLRLRPGLSLTAEIVTQRKTVLDILLAPVRKLRAEVADVG